MRADERTADLKKSFVDVCATFIPDLESPETVQPRVRTLDDPAMPAESLLGLNTLSGNPRRDATLAQGGPILLRVISLIRMQLVRTLARSSSGKLYGINGVKCRFQHRGVVDVGGSQYDREGDTLAVDHKMALRALFAAIRWIRPGFFAPPGEGTVEASMEARLQSIRSAWPSRSSKT